MKVILFGGSGMIGQGVLLECVRAGDVSRVLVVGRTTAGSSDPKVEELLHADFTDFSAVEARFAGYDACFYCLGVSSSGMSEADYTRVTYDYTVAAAGAVARQSPQAVICFVSGASTDATEQGKTMWARVKGRAENAVARMPFRAAYMFRPAIIQPLDGIRSKTPAYRTLYTLMAPLFPVVKAVFPRHVTTTERVGKAMLRIAREGAPLKILENPDINALGA
ncbi:MAG TPA: NAD-dependent epimerase/dehydratase family protein [Polyangiaceae bacterium]|jgi:uncharacterized protein YbjT (DUF2867 family)|nr:NAD-dependent epimerase/dehydratase family protein [Polyangiaceae bacterium]